MEITADQWDRIKNLFDAAVLQSASDRAAFLAQNCPEDKLRQQVEKLLRNHDEAGSFLSDPAVKSWNPASGQTSESHPTSPSAGFNAGSGLSVTATSAEVEDPMVGRHLGAYKLVRRVGQGGMAAVFLASRADDEYRKQVAIKLIPPGSDSGELLRRFRSERQTLAGLDHPNIVKLLDGGSTPEGLPFLVMDYVEGLPIDAYCDQHKLSVDERLHLFGKVCDAVQYAHQKRVIHRDLKPSNILVVTGGTPKLLDFGIAKVLNPESSGQRLLVTQTGTRCMTPAYASPEQMRGKAVTPATDIYSLGVVLYELLTGHRPYRLTQHTPAEMERAICEQEPEPPSTVISRVETDTSSDGRPITKTPELVSQTREGQPDKLRRRLRGDLDNIVLKALQKEPQRHRIEVSAAVIVLLVLAAATLLAFNTLGLRDRLARDVSQTQIRSLAVLPLANLSGDPAQEYFSDGMTDALITDLAQIGSLKVISRTSTMRYKKTDKSLPEIARELNVDGIIEGAVQRSGDRVRITAQLIYGPSDKHVWAGSYERDMRDVFTLERALTQEIAGQVQARLTVQDQAALAQPRPVDPNALDAYLQGYYYVTRGAGDEDMKKAQKYFQQAIDADPNYAPAYLGMADSHYALLRATTDDRAIRRAAVEKAVALDPSSSDARTALASVKFGDWDWRGGEEEVRRAIALNPNDANAHAGLCSCLDIMGRLDESLSECQLAQQLDPNYNHLSETMEARRQYDRAVELLLRETARSPDDGFLHYFLYRDYALLGKYNEAVHELEQSLTLLGRSEIAGKVHRAFATSGYRGALQEWVKDLEYLHATNQLFLPRVLAEVYAQLGEKDRAFYWLEQGYEHRDRIGNYGSIALLQVEHQLDPLRSDPRYADLVRRIGLPP